MMSEQPSEWVGCTIPFRPAISGSYDLFNAPNYPNVSTIEFVGLRDHEDVKKLAETLRKRIVWPTDAEIVCFKNPDLPNTFHTFFRSDQYEWAYDTKTDHVYAYPIGQPDYIPHYVASSMAEFWARFAIESDVFWLIDGDGDESKINHLFSAVNRYSQKDRENLWNDYVVKKLKTRTVLRNYLRFFFDRLPPSPPENDLRRDLDLKNSPSPQTLLPTSHVEALSQLCTRNDPIENQHPEEDEPEENERDWFSWKYIIPIGAVVAVSAIILYIYNKPKTSTISTH